MFHYSTLTKRARQNGCFKTSREFRHWNCWSQALTGRPPELKGGRIQIQFLYNHVVIAAKLVGANFFEVFVPEISEVMEKRKRQSQKKLEINSLKNHGVAVVGRGTLSPAKTTKQAGHLRRDKLTNKSR